MSVQIRQNGNSKLSAQSSNGADTSSEIEKLKKQLEERKNSIETRLTTSNKNISSTEDEINQLESKTLVGVFARMSGQKGVLEEQIKDEKRFRTKVEKERVEFNKTSEKVEKLLKEGKVEEAKAVLDGREAEYRANIKSASSRLATGYKQANQDLKDVDQFLGNREQDIDKAHNRLVILASLLSFGKGKAIMTAAKATAFGLTVGLSSNLAEGLSNTFQYGQNGKESSKTAALKTGKDAWTSFKVGATAGLGKVIGGLKSLAELPKIATAFISGSAVSAASSATDTTIGTITGEDKRTKTQKVVDFIKDTVIGGLSSMLGLKGEQWQQGKSAVKSALIRGTTDVAAPTALNYAAGNAANKATGREAQTSDQLIDSTLDNATSTLIGAHTNAKSASEPNTPQATKPQADNGNLNTTSNTAKQAPPPPKQNTKETPKLADAEHGNSNTNPEPANTEQSTKQVPPAPKQNTSQAPKPITGEAASAPQPQKVEVPKEVAESPSFKAAKEKGGVSVTRDENLPEGVEAQAVSTEKDGKRSTEIKLSKEHADGVENKNPASLQKLEHEVGHANQKMIDPVTVDKSGNRIIMTEAEYMARRAFQELEARAHADKALGSSENVKQFSELSDLILREGNYEKALEVARKNGLTDADVANYKSDYENNVNPNREKLVQRGNHTTIEDPFKQEYKNTLVKELTTLQTQLDDLKKEHELAESDYLETGKEEFLNKSIEKEQAIKMKELEIKKIESKINDQELDKAWSEVQSKINTLTNVNEKLINEMLLDQTVPLEKRMQFLEGLVELTNKNIHNEVINKLLETFKRNRTLAETSLEEAKKAPKTPVEIANKLKFDLCSDLKIKNLADMLGSATDNSNKNYGIRANAIELLEKTKGVSCKDGTTEDFINRLITLANGLKIRGRSTKAIERIFDDAFKTYRNNKNVPAGKLKAFLSGRYHEAVGLENEIKDGMDIWSAGIKTHSKLRELLKEIQLVYPDVDIKFPDEAGLSDGFDSEIDIVMVDTKVTPPRVILVENKASGMAKNNTSENQKPRQKKVASDYNAIRVEKIAGELVDRYDPKEDGPTVLNINK